VSGFLYYIKHNFAGSLSILSPNLTFASYGKMPALKKLFFTKAEDRQGKAKKPSPVANWPLFLLKLDTYIFLRQQK